LDDHKGPQISCLINPLCFNHEIQEWNPKLPGMKSQILWKDPDDEDIQKMVIIIETMIRPDTIKEEFTEEAIQTLVGKEIWFNGPPDSIDLTQFVQTVSLSGGRKVTRKRKRRKRTYRKLFLSV